MRDWEERIDELSNVQRLVHLAMRKDMVDEEAIRGELLKSRRRAYEQELTILARGAGCEERRGRLTAGEALDELNDESRGDSASVVNTFNFDLAVAIQAIGAQFPRANRHTYAKHLQTWDENRNKWKVPQIATWTEGSARSRAQADFVRLNGIEGVAVLVPEHAAEHICQGWINRGRVPLREAMLNRPPYHLGCIHIFEILADQVVEAECDELWVGE